MSREPTSPALWPPPRPALAVGVGLLVLAAVARLLWFGVASTHQDAVLPYLSASLIRAGDAFPLTGPPFARFLRHGVWNAWLSVPLLALAGSQHGAAALAAVLRGSTAALLFGAGRQLRAPLTGLALGLGAAVSFAAVSADRTGGGLTLAPPLLAGALWIAAAAHEHGHRWTPARAGGLAFVLGVIPWLHPFAAATTPGLLLACLPGWRRLSSHARRAAVVGLLLPAVPWCVAEVQVGFAGLASGLDAVTGQASLGAMGEGDPTVAWVLRTLGASWGWGVAPLTVLGAAALLAPGRLVPTPLGRALAPGLLLALAGIVGLLALSLRSGYVLEHHPTALAFPLAGGAFLALGGRAGRWTALPALCLAATLVLTVRGAPQRLGEQRSPDAGVVDWAQLEVAAQIVASAVPEGPVHLYQLHGPENLSHCVLSGVAGALIASGRSPDDFPLEAPEDPVPAVLIVVTAEDPAARLPANLRPLPVPEGAPLEPTARFYAAPDALTLKAWLKTQPADWPVWGPGEYLDLMDYARRLPRREPDNPELPVVRTPFHLDTP